MRRIIVAVLALGVLAGGGYGLWQFQQKAQEKSGPGASAARGGPPGGFAVPVEAEPVRIGRVAEEVLAVGSIRSNESVLLRPEVMGRIATISFGEGTRVMAGETLVQLDDSIPRAELAQAEANLALAQANASRAQELFTRGAGSGAVRDQATATLRTGVASVELARARLEKYRLAAPFDGIAGLRRVSPGEFVNVGQEIVNVESIDPIKVDFRVPEGVLASLRVGQQLSVRVDAFPDRSFSGEIYAIDPAADAAGRSIAIRARLPNPDGMLRPGLFARVVLTVREEPRAVLVPEAAVVPFGGRILVMKVVDGKSTPQPVTLGLRRDGMVQITEGLAEGDVVITAGQMKAQPGAAVAVVPPAAQPGAPPRPAGG
ncbi:efflux RND transporter periplasmic adaptor subunit [Elioraea sp.]|uniref:efflux RND transporter periplasmic adaptor subunit n=1 Tax=Elioraea sp. TaxID=2185103 RepID=UPI0025C15F15|nr:efflux RND transporter periplasmic adaptor subunit [Elioraea sp.]